MKIGILLTDELRDLLQPQHGDYAGMFKRLLAKGGFEYVVYDVRAYKYPAAPDDCDAYLITGSRHGVYDKLPWLSHLTGFIRRLHAEKIPLLGVCFGHQAVAHALGGQVEKSAKGWGLGVCEWKIRNQAPWMTSAARTLRLQCVHQDQVLRLPHQAALLAGNRFCPHAAFSIGGHIFCVQGHPEFSADYADALLDYLEGPPPEQVEEARRSLREPVDDRLCAQWIINFFRQAAARRQRLG